MAHEFKILAHIGPMGPGDVASRVDWCPKCGAIRETTEWTPGEKITLPTNGGRPCEGAPMATEEKEKGTITGERLDNIIAHAMNVVQTLQIKNPKYGDSWKSHGGFSAFFNTQRKWSRVENLASKYKFDLFAALRETDDEPDGMEETLKDLIGYALLALDECVAAKPMKCYFKSVAECTNPNCPVHGPHVVQLAGPQTS